MKILIGEPISPEAAAQMRAGGAQVDCIAQLGDVPLAEVIGQYDGLVVGQTLVVDASLLAQADKLSVIGKIGKDTNNIDLAAVTRAGVAVVNASEGVSASLAEYAIFAMLRLARLPKDGQLGHELKDKTLGIVGLGNVGAQVAKRAKAFDMRVICYDPSISRARAMVCDVELVDWVDLLVLSDFVTIHVPLNEDTRGLMNADNLSLMRQDACLISTTEPEVCDLDALAQALMTGRLGGAALDLPKGHEMREKLAACPHTLITEEQSTATEEARLGTAQEVVAEMLAYDQTGHSKNAINIPPIKESQRQTLNDGRRLAQVLGDFLGQLLKTPPQEIRLTYLGTLAACDDAPLVQWALTSLLQYVADERINYVNAALWAKEHQVMVIAKQEAEPSPRFGAMRIEVQMVGETRLIAGEINANGELRLTQIDGFAMDTAPEDHFLLIPHENKPGIVGKVGTVLGEYAVNINNMAVGRQQDASQPAMMVMTITRSVGEDVLQALAATPGVFDVQAIDLH